MKGFNLLGLKCRDRVTGMIGIVSSISYDLYGCIQGLLTPLVSSDGKRGDSWWLDIKRLEILDQTPIMNIPDFSNEPGGEKLPLPDHY